MKSYWSKVDLQIQNKNMSLSLQKDDQNMVLNGKLRLNICLCVFSIEATYSSFIELFLN